MNIKRTLSFGLAALLLGSLSAQAATFTWTTGAGGNSQWSTAGNWQGGTAPPTGAADTDLVFGPTTKTGPQLQNADYAIRSITFTGDAAAYTISSGGGIQILTMGTGGIVNNSLNLQTITIANITVAANQTWSAAAGNVVIGSAVALGNNILTLNGPADITLGGTVNGNGELVKDGAGTLSINGTASHLGGTDITAGLLRGSGSLTGTVTLNGGAIAGGDAGPGTLNTGSQIWNDGAIVVEMSSATGTAGIDWSLLNITGDLSVAAAPIDIRLVGMNGGAADNFDNAVAQEWVIATVSGDVNGFDPNQFNVNLEDFSNDLGGGTFLIGLSGSGDSIVASFVPIPEPSTTAMIVFGGFALGLLAIRRRR